MLEEAFLGDADDIFDQQSLSHPSLSSTPHRNPLHSSTLNSILSMKSPLDLNSSKDSPPQTKHLHSNESESNHWEASYVNKMKKQQKSNRNQASRSKGSTARRQSKEKRSANHRLLNETREEFHVNKEGGRAIAARMNGLGKVTLSIEQRQDDDSEDEEILKKLEESDEEEVESWTEEEEQEWDG